MPARTPIRHTLRRAVASLLFAAAAFAAAPAARAQQLPIIRFVRDPDLAPAFKLKDLAGTDVTLADYRGKVVLLNFWATWCGPCRAEIPSLVRLQDKYKDRLQILGLDVDDDDPDEVKKFVAEENINYPVLTSDTPVRIAYGGVTALPTVFVINAEGRVVQKHVGLFNPALYETEVRALLDLPIAARVVTFEDKGEIFLKHADRASELPGVDFSKLNMEQRSAALHKMNAENCTCGCQMTLAQCRIYDPACKISTERSAKIVKELLAASAAKQAEVPANASPATPPAQSPEAQPSAAPAEPNTPAPAAPPATPNPAPPNPQQTATPPQKPKTR